MKRLILLMFILTVACSMTACKSANNNLGDESETASFKAVISEITDTAIIVSPDEDSSEYSSSDLISLNGGEDIKLYDAEGSLADRSIFTVGAEVKVVYDSARGIAESYPAQIWALELHYVSSGSAEGDENSIPLSDSSYKSVNDFDYISMKVIDSTITHDGLTLELTSSVGRELIYGSFYALEVKYDGKWYQLPYILEDGGGVGWDAIAYIIPAGGSSQWSTDWNWLYGSLDEGTYRIIKDVYDNNEDGESKSCYLAAEFTISDGIDYIRTDGYVVDAEYPDTTLIKNMDAFGTYISENEDAYNFQSDEFKTAAQRYDEAYFENNALVLVLLEESSGSIRHEVTSITDEGDINITRDIPEIGTDDMAQWHIFIELPKTHPAILNDAAFNVSLN